MSKKKRDDLEDLRAANQLAVHATEQVTKAVEAMHTTIAGGPAILGKPLSGAVGLINGLVYGSIRGATRLVGKSIEIALGELAPLFGQSEPGPEREAAQAALNGVVGDYLAQSKNALAIEMQLRRHGQPLVLEEAELRAQIPEATGKLLVLVHGSCMNDIQWSREGHDHGAALERDLGYTPVYVHYNSGLHVSENGLDLDEHLDRLVSAWPRPVESITLLCHSMGGLIARSACHSAETRATSKWRPKLQNLVTLGSPHHGAPLERGGMWVGALLGVSRYSAPLAPLARLRSAGVTDLRFGNVLEEHWSGQDRFALRGDQRKMLSLPEGVACYAIAGNSTLGGDGLVLVDSALGRHSDPALALEFPEDHRWVGEGIAHLDLLSRAEVYAQLRAWLDR